jgi:hypothetical protein
LRRLKEEPLVPIGCVLTVMAFTNAWRASRRGDHHKVQRMFRARVAAQGFTVLAMVAGGMYYAEDRNKQKELRKLKQTQEAEEKRQKWIKELEARDEEDKALHAMLEKKRKRAAERATNTESGTDGVAAQARAALKEAKAAKENSAADGATAQPLSEAAGNEETASSGVLSSVGRWFGGANKAHGDSTEVPTEQKHGSEGVQKK